MKMQAAKTTTYIPAP